MLVVFVQENNVKSGHGMRDASAGLTWSYPFFG